MNTLHWIVVTIFTGFTSISLAASYKILPFYTPPDSPNALLQTIMDMRDNIHTIGSHEEINVKDLLHHRLLAVSNTRSIILDSLLAEEIMNRNFKPNEMLLNNRKSSQLKFYEFCFDDMEEFEEDSDWLPVGSCIYNTLSNTSSSYSFGWSVSQGTGANGKIEFSQILGITPSIKLDISYSSSIGGSTSCSVNGGSILQLQIRFKSVKLSKVKSRDIILSKHRLFNNRHSSLVYGEWKEEDEYTGIRENSINVACVTDPRYLSC